MPTMRFTNPLRSLDLTKFDVRSFDPRKITLPNVDLRKTVAPAAKIARDAAYVAVGLGVIATQKASARRYDLEQRVKDLAPRVRDEAKATAERVLREANDNVVRVRDEATQRVRKVVDRRKAATSAAATADATTVA
ncbi:MAG: hypothetical protein EBZ68_03350 [Actinobacteria bacterium]|nr:hypothetical protein [Actinomycetota bacterium]